MNHKIILKCRICLDEFDEEKMFELFASDNASREPSSSDDADKTLKLYEKVEYCCGVKLRESPEMPSKICIKCFDLTRIWFNFHHMCINSQVYLESMCKDREKPKDCDNFLEYLMEDLQTFRAEARQVNPAFSVNSDSDEQDDSDDAPSMKEEQFETDEEFLEALPIEDVDSDPDLDNALKNIKEEDEDYDPNENDSKKRKPAKQKRSTSAKKSPGFIAKKYFRPPSPTSYMCSICGNVYTKKTSFHYHMSLHSNVKPHECELCGKAFRQVCELKNHMRRHTGEKPYKCSFCDRHFTDRSEKHRHERVHTNTRPYKCSVCGKSFMYSAILKNHMKLHSGEKDFNCLVCQKAFTLQHQLKAHLQTITHKQKEAQFVSAGYEVVYE